MARASSRSTCIRSLSSLVTTAGSAAGSGRNGSPTTIRMWCPRSFCLRPLVQTRWLPHTITGMIGTSASTAIRTAPVLNALSSKLCETVASGKTPTSSPLRQASTAASKLPAPASRSTGMCFMPRIRGPLILWSKTSFLAMKRTSRFLGRKAQAGEGEVEVAGVVDRDHATAGGRARCSSPLMSNFSPSARNTPRAKPMTGT